MSEEELPKVIFYWHKHPNGCPGASSGDEEDTFDVFMDENSGRKVFGFLQTANSESSGFKYEARIEMRKPIWASMEATLITDEDSEIEKECKKIIKDKIKEGNASASDQPGLKPIERVNLQQYFSKKKEEEDKETKDFNDSWREANYDSSEYFQIENKDGCIKLEYPIFLMDWIEDLLLKDNIQQLIRKVIDKDEEDCHIKILQPQRKCLATLHSELLELQKVYFGKTASKEEIEEAVDEAVEATLRAGVATNMIGKNNVGDWDIQSWYHGGC